MKDTDKNQAIELLKEELERKRKEVAATELMLAELKRQNAPAFIERKPVRAWMHVMKTITSPFAHIHQENQRALNDPIGYQREKMLSKAQAELARCKEIENNKHRHARTTAVRAARMIIMLEEEAAREEWIPGEHMIQSLREELARIRPEKNEEQKKVEQETKDKVVQLVEAALSPKEPEVLPVTTG